MTLGRALFALGLAFLAAPAGAEDDPVRLGVVAPAGKALAAKQWQATADYLSKAIPGTRFEIVPLAYDEADRVMGDGQLDFILANPMIYVDLEARRGATRIATLIENSPAGPLPTYGGAMIARADNPTVQGARDLKGKTVIAASEASFGGYQIFRHELRKMGVDLEREPKALTFANIQDEAVRAVIAGWADVGLVRTGVIERMIAAGEIGPKDIKVIRLPGARGDYPLQLSTAAYPGWPIARAAHTDDDLARKVAVALMALEPDAAPSRASDTAGWTVPLNYAVVHELMRDMKLGPYARLGEVTFADVFRTHAAWVIGVLALIGVMAFGLFELLALNRNLALSRAQLRLAHDELERMVGERTADLSAEMEHRRRAETERGRESQRVKDALVQTVRAVALTIETRDPYTAGHQQRVARLAAAIAREMGMGEAAIEGIYLAGLVHDIGMVYVPSEISNRPGPLTPIEFEIVKSHPRVGHDILATVELPWPLAETILQHHRRLDGSGYPADIEGPVPKEACIIAVADVLEAMCAHRPYRPAPGLAAALAEIEGHKGTLYDPEAVEASLRLLRDKGFQFR